MDVFLGLGIGGIMLLFRFIGFYMAFIYCLAFPKDLALLGCELGIYFFDYILKT